MLVKVNIVCQLSSPVSTKSCGSDLNNWYLARGSCCAQKREGTYITSVGILLCIHFKKIIIRKTCKMKQPFLKTKISIEQRVERCENKLFTGNIYYYLCPLQIIEKSVISLYHGNKISGSQQSFLQDINGHFMICIMLNDERKVLSAIIGKSYSCIFSPI